MLPPHWDSERAQPLFPTALPLSQMRALLVFKARRHGGSSSWSKSPNPGLRRLALQGGTSVVVRFLLPLGHHMWREGGGPDWTQALPPTFSMWLFLWIHGGRKSVLRVARSFSGTAPSCAAVALVPMRRAELRIFPLCHREPKLEALPPNASVACP